MQNRRDLRALARRPGYGGFVATVALVRISGAMFTTGGVLFVLVRTHSPGLAGLTAAAATLPGALSGPWLGAWLDVAERRRVLIVADQLCSVVALAAILALAGHGPNWTLPVVAVLYSITRPFSSSGFWTALAELAGPELIDPASAIESVSLNLAYIVGPALAGVLAGVAGAAAALEVQAAATLLSAGLIAANPAFEARAGVRASSTRRAMVAGLRALRESHVLRATGVAGALAGCGWGVMAVGFPLLAEHSLHAGAHASGFLWAALATGSILGTFGLAGRPSLARVSLSYGALGLSGLLWPLGHVLVLGIGLVLLTGFLEGPAYSGTIALRQRHTPPRVRGQVMSTITGVTMVAYAAGAALGGVLGGVTPVVLAFTGLNLLAALAARTA